MLRRIWLTVLFAVLLTGCSSTPAVPTATPGIPGVKPVSPPVQVENFTLTGMNGSPAHLKDFEGKSVLMVFGYTHCPDICPVTLARFKQIKQLLGADADKVQFIFVSVDGNRDTPERLTEYLGLFDKDFFGLTGSEDEARAVITLFDGVFTIKDAEGLRKDYLVEHTASSFLMDAEGRWVRTYEYNTDPNIVATDMLKVISSPSATSSS